MVLAQEAIPVNSRMCCGIYAAIQLIWLYDLRRDEANPTKS